MAQTINLNDVQHEPIIVSASLTASLNRYYVNIASSTYTDPTPLEGKGYIVFIRNGTATIGASPYLSGSVVYRYYHSGAWASYEQVVYDSNKILVDAGGVSLNTDGIGQVTLGGQLLLQSDSFTISANTNNLDVGDNSIIALTPSGTYDLTGIDSGAEARILILYNQHATNTLTLKNNVTSTASNRFSFPESQDYSLKPLQSVMVHYYLSRWRLVGTKFATPFELAIAASDETTALTTGTAKVTFRMPRAMTLTAVRASLTTAQASGNIFTVDINESGATILSTKLTIDNTEKTSTTAATATVISDTSLADDAEITVDIDQVGDGTAKGLKIYLIGTIS